MKKLKRMISNAVNILKGGETKKKYLYVFYIAVIAALILEIFVFNFRSVESVFYRGVNETEFSVSNAYKASDGEYVSSGGSVEIIAYNIGRKLNNVYIGLERDEDRPYTGFTLNAVDAANAKGVSAPRREIVQSLENTKYIRTHFGGEVEKLTIKAEIPENDRFKIERIGLNCRVPIYFSVVRFLFVICMIMLLYTIRPKSFIYKHAVDLKKRWQKTTVLVFVIASMAAMWGICHINPQWQNPPWYYNYQYQELSEALLNGHTYLDKEPPKELAQIDNPYDTGLRADKKINFLWDHAYYDGKYYVYFGIVPELVYYLPYKLITKHDFPNYLAVYINCALLLIAAMCLLHAVIKRWFKHVSFGAYMLMSILVAWTSGIMYILKHADFYAIPITMAAMFSMFGLCLWINAEKKGKHGIKRLSARHLFWGSVCMALVGGCRPHVLLTTFFGVILFWNCVFKDRTLFSKKSIKNTVAICLPYVIIGGGLMLYNYVRFHSPFDFGANYNLTTNDMTHRGFVADRNLTGILYYLLHPLTFTNKFPYLNMVDVTTQYQGVTIFEKIQGGLIWISPIIVLGFRGIKNRQWYKKMSYTPYIISVSAIAMAVVLTMLDAQVAGILTRYMTDFSWVFLLAAAIAVFAEYEWQGKCDKLTKFIVICFVFSFVVNSLMIFSDFDNSIELQNPDFYYRAKYIIGFLL